MKTDKAEHLRKLIATYAMRSGEEFKRGMPTVIREAYKTECWKDSRKPDGKPFEWFIEWLETPPPPGCGLGATPDAITFAELLAMCEKVAPDVADILTKEQKRGKRGGDKRSKEAKDQTTARLFDKGGTKRSTLSIRLSQEHPEVYQAFLNGEHNSVRAAAEAAGIVKPGHDPLMRCKAYWRKLSKAERKVFAKWMEEQ